MEELKNDIISTAESFTKNFSDYGDLDYTVQSLSLVDSILEGLREYEIDEETLSFISSMVGSYIFEVARKIFSGQYYWNYEKEQPVLVTGEPSYSISLYAFDKVKARLENGQEDNIPFYFDGYVSSVKKGKESGYCSTIL